MKFSNFRNYKMINMDNTFLNKNVFADIDVTIGIWPFKKVVTKKIGKEYLSTYWVFLDWDKKIPIFDNYNLNYMEKSYRLKEIYNESRSI